MNDIDNKTQVNRFHIALHFTTTSLICRNNKSNVLFDKFVEILDLCSLGLVDKQILLKKNPLKQHFNFYYSICGIENHKIQFEVKQPKTETARQRTSRSLKIPSSLYIQPRESRNHLCSCNFKTINYEMISKPFLCIVIQLKTEILSRLLKTFHYQPQRTHT